MHPPDATLEARGLHKSFGAVKALDGVTLRVAEGSCTALVGESGSGKTTLLRTFNAMVTPDAGTVHVRGTDVAAADPVPLRRSIGYVQQEGGLMPHWTVLRNVGLVPRLLGRPDVDAKARRALDLVGLPARDFDGRWPKELSGGQRQRVAIARALAAEPKVMLLDEPFGALDAITRVDVQETFAMLRRSLELTVLLVTHDLREAFALADRIGVMRSGSIEQIGSQETLRGSPSTPYVTELLEKAGVA
jgi:osmoprotectant transport system ATP-binding protein